MTKQELCTKLLHDDITLDEIRNLPQVMTGEEVGDILAEMMFTLSVECKTTHQANRCLLGCLLQKWWNELEEVK